MTDKISQGGPTGRMRSARVWNGLVDMLDSYKAGALGKPPPHLAAPSTPSIVKVKNETGDDLRGGEVLEFTGFALTNVKQDLLWFSGDTPDLSHVGWGITRQPIPNGKIDDCQVAGGCAALVNVTSESHKYALLKSGETVLQSAASGRVRILYKPSGTGEKECAVLIGVSSSAVYLGKTDAPIAKGSSGLVSRYEGASGSETDTGENDTAKNRFANVGGNKWVAYVDIDGTLYLIAKEC